MIELIQKTIALLKLKVKSNLELINKNQVKIKEILKEPNSSKRTTLFEEHYETNKSLLAENNDFISVQLTLINFLEKHKDTLISEDNPPVLEVECFKNEKELFDLTVKGTIAFNEKHPKYNNESFFKKLLHYYQDIEAYEKCQALLNLKKSK
jgi:hypothetical protein